MTQKSGVKINRKIKNISNHPKKFTFYFLFGWCFETGSYYVAQAGLELPVIFLPRGMCYYSWHQLIRLSSTAFFYPLYSISLEYKHYSAINNQLLLFRGLKCLHSLNVLVNPTRNSLLMITLHFRDEENYG